MMICMYSYKFDENIYGKARLEGADASYKDLAEVCSNIRGKSGSGALSLLEKASRGEFPILYRKYISKLAHRRELGGRPGRYPEKAARLVLGTLKSAIASAKAKGMSEDLIVVHAAANKKEVFPRLSPKGGKRTRSYYETARVEIVVRERNPVSKKAEKESEAAGKAKKEDAKTTAGKKTGETLQIAQKPEAQAAKPDAAGAKPAEEKKAAPAKPEKEDVKRKEITAGEVK